MSRYNRKDELIATLEARLAEAVMLNNEGAAQIKALEKKLAATEQSLKRFEENLRSEILAIQDLAKIKNTPANQRKIQDLNKVLDKCDNEKVALFGLMLKKK